MENTTAVNFLFVESSHICEREGCENDCRVIDTISGHRFCEAHAPRLWVEDAFRNARRIEEERQSHQRPTVVW